MDNSDLLERAKLARLQPMEADELPVVAPVKQVLNMKAEIPNSA